MKKPNIPQDEQARLRALRSINVLDSPPEERFDRLTRMAKRLFGVSIAMVSLADEDHQWLKSYAGLSATETPKYISFCGHAILGDEILIVEDASKDDRFADDPLVVSEPNIRFYAGCPLRDLNGVTLGTLCIIDENPRALSVEDLEAFADLASMAERELAAVQMATVDELTDILNRRGFLTMARHSLSICTRQKIPAVLIFADLNQFKPINDNFGHAEGDRALAAFAHLMKSAFRESDLFARIGGDEFVVLLTNTTHKFAEEVVARFQASLEQYNQQANRGYEISFSHGVVEFNPENHPTIEDLLAEGDALMYTGKGAKYKVGSRA